jgi:Rrf2 family protein
MLSKKTKYSLLALAKLAKEYGKGPVFISTIAKSENIPQRFLEGILLELKKIGILGSKSGKSGGYYLIKNPKEINLSDIIRSIEGPIALLPCVSEKFYQPCETCKNEEECKIRLVFKNIRDASYEILRNTYLIDLV